MKLVRYYDGRRIYHFVNASKEETKSICDWCQDNLALDGEWLVITPVINLRERWIRTGSTANEKHQGDLLLITRDENDATLIDINWGGVERKRYQ